MKITFRMWIMFAFVALALISIFSIPPTFTKKGVLITSVEKNSSIYEAGLRPNMIIISINKQKVNNMEDYSKAIHLFVDNLPNNQTQKLTITTETSEVIGLFSNKIIKDISVDKIPKTRIVTGLDLQGGVRALVTAENHTLTDSELNDLISVTQERLNVYGLSDVKVIPRQDSSGNKYMSIEIAGSSPSDLDNLIAQQGKFDAKIGNITVFRGGQKDITFVGSSGQDALITECFDVQNGQACNFRFVISLTEEAAQRQADATSNLSLNISTGGKYLEKPLDLYLDGVKIDTLNIGADLKGKVATQIQISGSGTGADRNEALETTKANMKKLQTILKTGSLPFKLKIEKIDRISPNLGEGFIKTIFTAGLLAIVGVFIIVFIRYRKIKISFTMICVMLSEIIIVLGAAALINWNLDLAAIAGIIAAIGTGIDDQIVILDESRRSKESSIKQRIKAALFIIFTAYATSVVSLLPLMNAGAGLLAGFAVTTIIGISAGVLITRPAFADIVQQIEE